MSERKVFFKYFLTEKPDCYKQINDFQAVEILCWSTNKDNFSLIDQFGFSSIYNYNMKVSEQRNDILEDNFSFYVYKNGYTALAHLSTYKDKLVFILCYVIYVALNYA